MRWWQSLAAGNQGLDLRGRQLRSPDHGHRLNHHASLQAAADCLVLGGLSDDYPLQRHLGAATAASARFRLLQDGVADRAKLRCSMLAPGRSPLAGLVEVDETQIACRSKNDPVTGGGGRSHQGKMLVVVAVEVEYVGIGPGRIRLCKIA